MHRTAALHLLAAHPAELLAQLPRGAPLFLAGGLQVGVEGALERGLTGGRAEEQHDDADQGEEGEGEGEVEEHGGGLQWLDVRLTIDSGH